MVTQPGKDGAVRRAALGGAAAGLVIGLAACGSAVAGAGSPGKPAAARPAASKINPGGPMVPATAPDHVLLCAEIPKLTRLVVTRAAWPPVRHAHEVLPSGVTIRNAATVRRIATLLCGLPKLPAGTLSCPNLSGGSYRLYFAAPGKPIPPVAIQLSGCRVVTGLGPPRSWTASTQLQQELSRGLGGHFQLIPPHA